MCAMTHSYIPWSCNCLTWLIHMCDMTHSYVWHDSFICVTRLIHICDMTHSYMWHDTGGKKREHQHVSMHVCVYVRTHMHVCTYLLDTLVGGSTGWRRLIGSLIFIGHFPQKSRIFSGSFVENDLQLRGSYESSPPCSVIKAGGKKQRTCVFLCICVRVCAYAYMSVHIHVTYLLGGVVWSRQVARIEDMCMYVSMYICVYKCLYIFTWHTCWGE